MGSSLVTHKVGAAAHRMLLAEYLTQPLKPLEECAQIYIGTNLNDSDDGPTTDHTATHRHMRHPHSSSSSGASHRGGGSGPHSYGRHLSPTQFDEVFGLLVADTEPHFAMFQTSERKQSVSAHVAFIGIALLMRAELHAKLWFLLRLYGDAHGQISAERKHQLPRDVVAALQRTLRLTEPSDSEFTRHVERVLGLGRDDPQATTCRELYDACLTDARISGALHAIQTAVEGEHAHYTAHMAAAAARSPPQTARTSKLRLMKRSASALHFAALQPQPLLWVRKAGQFPRFWQQTLVRVSRTMSVRAALQRLTEQDTTRLLVFGHSDTDCCALLTMDDLLLFFVDLLAHTTSPSMITSHSASDYKHRVQFAIACQRLEELTVRDALIHAALTNDSASVDSNNHTAVTAALFGAGKDGQSSSKAKAKAKARLSRRAGNTRYRCISEDESFFNVVLRLACGAEAVAVLRRATIESPPDTVPLYPNQANATGPSDSLLGYLSACDLLEWLAEDLSLLNGQELNAVGAFPTFFCEPAGMPRDESTLVDALIEMQARRVTGLRVLPTARHTGNEPKALGSVLITGQALRDVITAQLTRRVPPETASSAALSGSSGNPASSAGSCSSSSSRPHVNDLPVQLHDLIEANPDCFQECLHVDVDDSLAHAVEVMCSARVRRIYIKRAQACTPDKRDRELGGPTIVGVIRATDILLLLLREQHRHPRLL